MRSHLHVDQLAGTPRELDGDRSRFAGTDYSFLSGGAGMTVAAPPPTANGTVVGAGGVQPHHSVVAIVLVAVLILYALDKAGFRFAVTAGRR